jgi:type III pantothenate kinase
VTALLLIDAGNTRVKWALAQDGALARGGHAVHRGQVLEQALAPLAGLAARPRRALVANVGGPVLGERLQRLVRERFGLAVEMAVVRREAFGLRVAYEHPERLGVDRWLAMLGARAACAGAVLVAGVGTAMTIDAVDAGGAHLGGLIVPGIGAMKEALLTGTAGIRDAGDDGGTPEIFAADTGAAVSAGAAHALAALVERAAAALARRAGAPASVLLTGGDAPRIRPLLALPATVAPDLVLHGLVVYARGR